nr:hypothetical protein [Tanacetum cinerariifolium]
QVDTAYSLNKYNVFDTGINTAYPGEPSERKDLVDCMFSKILTAPMISPLGIVPLCTIYMRFFSPKVKVSLIPVTVRLVSGEEYDKVFNHLDMLNVSFKGKVFTCAKQVKPYIFDNCKKGLGYESYNAVPPSYTRNFMPLKPDLSFTGLDKFANKPVGKNSNAKSSKEHTKAVRKNDDAPIIKEWVSDNEEENVTQPKTEKKTVRPNIVKKEFVKSKQQKNARKTIKNVEQNRQNTYRPMRQLKKLE